MPRNSLRSSLFGGSLGGFSGGGSAGIDASDSSMSGYNDEDENTATNLQKQAALNTRKSLARTETKAVRCMRYVVIVVLLGTAIGVSVATFLYSRSIEQEAFESEFESVAVTTLRSFVEAVEHKLSAMDALAVGITSHSLSTGETFPNVTVPDFEIKAAIVRVQTDSIYTFYLPLVTDEHRAGYELYTKMQQAKIFAGYMQEEALRQYQDMYFNVSNEATAARAEEAKAEAEADHQGGAAEQEVDVDANTRNRFLHVAPPEIHPTIHDGIWGLSVRTKKDRLYIAVFCYQVSAFLKKSHSHLFFFNTLPSQPRNDTWEEPEGAGPYLPMWQLSVRRNNHMEQ